MKKKNTLKGIWKLIIEKSVCHVRIWGQPPSGWNQNQTALKSSLSQWSPRRRETLLAVVESSSGTSETSPPPYGRITMQVHPDHMIQLQGESRGEMSGGRRHGRHWVKDHTYRSNTSQSNFTDTTSHSFVIWSSLNMQQAQGVNRHFPQSSGSLSRSWHKATELGVPSKSYLVESVV